MNTKKVDFSHSSYFLSSYESRNQYQMTQKKKNVWGMTRINFFTYVCGILFDAR